MLNHRCPSCHRRRSHIPNASVMHGQSPLWKPPVRLRVTLLFLLTLLLFFVPLLVTCTPAHVRYQSRPNLSLVFQVTNQRLRIFLLEIMDVKPKFALWNPTASNQSLHVGTKKQSRRGFKTNFENFFFPSPVYNTI